jgi:hypothetical protein
MSRFAGVSDAANRESESPQAKSTAAKLFRIVSAQNQIPPTALFPHPHRCMESTTYKITKL